jgi:hypothetical protein
MKNLFLPFLVAVLLGIGACDDATINPPKDDKKDTTDTLKNPITEDIVFVDTEKDSVGVSTYLFAINRDGSGRRKIRRMPENMNFYTFSPDMKKLLVLSGTANSIKVLSIADINEEGFKNIASPTASSEFSNIEWLPDSKYFVFKNSGNIYKSDGITHNQLVSNIGSSPTSVSPAGSTVIYYRKDGGGIMSFDVNTLNETLIFPYTVYNKNNITLKFSPSGSKIIFCEGGNNGRYCIINKDGSNPKYLNIPSNYGSAATYVNGVSVNDWSGDEQSFISGVGYIGSGGGGNGGGTFVQSGKIWLISIADNRYIDIGGGGYFAPDNNSQILNYGYINNGNVISLTTVSNYQEKGFVIITSGSVPRWASKR